MRSLFISTGFLISILDAILSFIVVHVYMITTGHTIFANTRAMVTGWEEVADKESVGDWEYKT